MSRLQNEYLKRLGSPSDISEDLEMLYALALKCVRIVEFGVRTGNSTIAFLAGLQAGSQVGGALHSYDIEAPQVDFPWSELTGVMWHFRKEDTAHLERIPECDLLFIDTAHTRLHVAAELQYHAAVRKFIVFHDTVLWGIVGMDGKTGVLHVALDFLASRPEWEFFNHSVKQNGLLVLRRKGAA